MKLILLTILLSAYAGKIHAQSESTLPSAQYISQTALVKPDLREDTNISTQAFAAPVSSLPAEIPATAYRAPMGMLSDTNTAIHWSKLTADYVIPALMVKGDTIFSEARHLSHRMLRSYDGGSTWLTKDDGMAALDLSSIAVMGNSIFCSSETRGGVCLARPGRDLGPRKRRTDQQKCKGHDGQRRHSLCRYMGRRNI